ncbi:MAG: poly-beta-1,6-N-acetyl-D-glucosamine N-deacetylase PgaB [Thermodesulfobacteriota bacterium]
MSNFKFILITVLLLCCCRPPASAAAKAPTAPYITGRSFQALAYHDVVDSVDQLDADAITLETLVNHFEWLQQNGYHPISIDDLIAAKKNERPLPDKALLLCWDDAYRSFYTHVFPLLKAYGYPAVLALVGEWKQTAEGTMVLYGDEEVPRSHFLGWQQIREISDSGLVEIASHSMNMHRSQLATPSGDRLPIVLGLHYDSSKKKYVDHGRLPAEIARDLQTSSDLIFAKTGKLPRVMVWPYGRYNTAALDAAGKAGMEITLTLDSGHGSIDNLAAVPRSYPGLNAETANLKQSLQEVGKPPLLRFIKVDSNDLIETDISKEANFSQLLERVWQMQPGNLMISPIVQKDGEIQALFPNERYPVLQDRLTRLCWHPQRRVATGVSLWLDELLFPANADRDEDIAFFEAMGRAAPCNGLVLDIPELAKELLQLITPSIDVLDGTEPRWDLTRSRKIRDQLIRSSDSAMTSRVFRALQGLQKWQPQLGVGLVIPPELITALDNKTTNRLLKIVDYLVPDLREKATAEKPGIKKWLAQNGLAPYQPFMTPLLTHQPSAGKRLKETLERLQQYGFVNRAYTGDHFLEGQPELPCVQPLISTRQFPFIPK